MKKMTALLPLLLAAALTLTACGSEETSKSIGDTSTANVKFNDADVTFATDMITHHEQAVEMSQMASSRAQSADVKTLADDIAAAQGPEIDTMTQWLKDWGQDAPSGRMDQGDMGHGTSDQMPGMMDADHMGRLGRAHGRDWDHMFLTMMIAHHEGAIEMAKKEQAHGKNADAVALAKNIETAQTSEIANMKDLLKR
jgi:uncharacterized protein (DUF305 family)